jgi:hypothetical protein
VDGIRSVGVNLRNQGVVPRGLSSDSGVQSQGDGHQAYLASRSDISRRLKCIGVLIQVLKVITGGFPSVSVGSEGAELAAVSCHGAVVRACRGRRAATADQRH